MRFFEEVQEHNESVEWEDMEMAEYEENWGQYLDDNLDLEPWADDSEFSDDEEETESVDAEMSYEELQANKERRGEKELIRKGKQDNYDDSSARKTPGNRQRSSIVRTKERGNGKISEILAQEYEESWREALEEREQIPELIALETDQESEPLLQEAA